MWPRSIGGIVLCVVGFVWTLQGVGVLHGSPMTGQAQWAVFGAIAIAVGAWLLRTATRMRVR